MNSSIDSSINKTYFVMKDLVTENDNNTSNTNLSYLNMGQFSSNKLKFKNNLLESKTRGTYNSSSYDILGSRNSLGLPTIRKNENSKILNKIINLNKEKFKESWIDITSHDISKIILIKIIDQCYFEGHLYLKNKFNSEYILAKFINDKNWYTITPSFFFIKPGSEIIINIKRFYKLAPDEMFHKVNDNILMIVGKTKNEIEDLNDVKVYLRKEDIFSPDYQLFSFTLMVDNGHNPVYYDKLIEERKKKMDLFYEKPNINGMKNANSIKQHIENISISINEYKKKIIQKEKEFDKILAKNEKKNINKEKNNFDKINNNNIKVVDKEVFYELKEQKGIIKQNENENNGSQNFYNKIFDMTHDEDGVTIPMVLFGLSICLYIGKFLKSIIFS